MGEKIPSLDGMADDPLTMALGSLYGREKKDLLGVDVVEDSIDSAVSGEIRERNRRLGRGCMGRSG